MKRGGRKTVLLLSKLSAYIWIKKCLVFLNSESETRSGLFEIGFEVWIDGVLKWSVWE